MAVSSKLRAKHSKLRCRFWTWKYFQHSHSLRSLLHEDENRSQISHRARPGWSRCRTVISVICQVRGIHSRHCPDFLNQCGGNIVWAWCIWSVELSFEGVPFWSGDICSRQVFPRAWWRIWFVHLATTLTASSIPNPSLPQWEAWWIRIHKVKLWPVSQWFLSSQK